MTVEAPLQFPGVSLLGAAGLLVEGRSVPMLIVPALQLPDPGKPPHHSYPQVWSDNIHVFFLKWSDVEPDNIEFPSSALF